MTYSAADNNPLLIRNGVIVDLEADIIPIGQGERTEAFRTFQVPLQKGDCLYLYADGYADQIGGPKGKKIKYKKLNELLVSCYNYPIEKNN